ncbi:MAG: hypothetical protein IKX33_06540 [Prevotella sp.]|nr:hypothetical protein [Prevotella sp.]
MKKIYIIPTCTNESVKLFGDLLKEGDPNPGGGSRGTNFVDANEDYANFEEQNDLDYASPKSSLWDE